MTGIYELVVRVWYAC